MIIDYDYIRNNYGKGDVEVVGFADGAVEYIDTENKCVSVFIMDKFGDVVLTENREEIKREVRYPETLVLKFNGEVIHRW